LVEEPPSMLAISKVEIFIFWTLLVVCMVAWGDWKAWCCSERERSLRS
jgi:hypothetical protein